MTVTGNSYSPGTLKAGTEYYWRVFTYSNLEIVFSDVWRFTTEGESTALPPGTPTNPLPTSGATGVSTTPALSWTGGSGAASHDVYFGTSTTPPLVGNTTGTSYSPGALNAGTTYYWQVVARNSAGSTASLTWSFSTQVVVLPPGTPTNPLPTSGATGVSTTPALSWTGGSGAASYDVYFGTSTTPPLVGNTTGTSYSPGALNAGTTFYWLVVARNSAGSTASLTWSFSTQVVVLPPGTPTNPLPTSGATGVSTTPALSWTGASGAASYDVYFGTSTTPPLAGNTTGTSYSPGALNAGTTYYWQVVARNSAGSTPSSMWSFVVSISGGDRKLLFVAVTPCRIVDTRAGQGKTGAFGPPTLQGGQIREIPVPSSVCGIPSSAEAYSLNFTVVPAGQLSYLTTWPTGVSQPLVSTLNSFDGRILANAAIVPAGTNGSINVFVSDKTDVIVDINGYFIP